MDFNFDDHFKHVWADQYDPDRNEQGPQLEYIRMNGETTVFLLDWNTDFNMPLLTFSTTRGASFQHFLIDGLGDVPTLMELFARIGLDKCTFEMDDDEVLTVSEALNHPVRGQMFQMYLYQTEEPVITPK